jgi:hypothetical protein
MSEDELNPYPQLHKSIQKSHFRIVGHLKETFHLTDIEFIKIESFPFGSPHQGILQHKLQLRKNPEWYIKWWTDKGKGEVRYYPNDETNSPKKLLINQRRPNSLRPQKNQFFQGDIFDEVMLISESWYNSVIDTEETNDRYTKRFLYDISGNLPEELSNALDRSFTQYDYELLKDLLFYWKKEVEKGSKVADTLTYAEEELIRTRDVKKVSGGLFTGIKKSGIRLTKKVLEKVAVDHGAEFADKGGHWLWKIIEHWINNSK